MTAVNQGMRWKRDWSVAGVSDLTAVDKRTRGWRHRKQHRAELVAALGGEERLTAHQLLQLDIVLGLTALVADFQARLAAGEPIDSARFIAAMQGAPPRHSRAEAAARQACVSGAARSHRQARRGPRCRERRMMSIIEAMDDPLLFSPYFHGKTWNAWRTILKAAYALPMTPEEIAFFRSVAERDPPEAAGQRTVRDRRPASGQGQRGQRHRRARAALFVDGGQLRPGERPVVMCLACDRDQARIVKNYIASYFNDIPMLNAMIERETAQGFELSNRIDVFVSTNSFRAVRGRPILCAIFDEVAFWRDDASATPDIETYNAVKPGLATMPGSMIVGISIALSQVGFAPQEVQGRLRQARRRAGDQSADGDSQSDHRPGNHRRGAGGRSGCGACGVAGGVSRRHFRLPRRRGDRGLHLA